MKIYSLSLLMFMLFFCHISEASQLYLIYQNNSVSNATQITIEPNKTWTNFLNYQGIKVEYKFKACNSELVKNQVLVLFKFTNLTSSSITFSWTTKIWRNNICRNCNDLDDSEYSHSITLGPNEIVTADGLSKENKSLYIFANFIKLSPGMSNQTLTNFEFINPIISLVP